MKRQTPSIEVTDMYSSSNKKRIIHSNFFEFTGLPKSSTTSEANDENFKSFSDYEPEEAKPQGKEPSFKIDRCEKFRCIKNLKKLMEQPNGTDFNIGFELGPINLKLNSMEIIMSKLEKDMYFGADEFVAEIRLMLSDAILNYPPKHKMHRTAKQLRELFEKNWKSLKEHWKTEKLEEEDEDSKVQIRTQSSRKLRQSLKKAPSVLMASKEEKNIYNEEVCDNFSVPCSLHNDCKGRRKEKLLE